MRFRAVHDVGEEKIYTSSSAGRMNDLCREVILHGRAGCVELWLRQRDSRKPKINGVGMPTMSSKEQWAIRAASVPDRAVAG